MLATDPNLRAHLSPASPSGIQDFVRQRHAVRALHRVGAVAAVPDEMNESRLREVTREGLGSHSQKGLLVDEFEISQWNPVHTKKDSRRAPCVPQSSTGLGEMVTAAEN